MEIVKLECNLLVSYKKISINISDRELQKISPILKFKENFSIF